MEDPSNDPAAEALAPLLAEHYDVTGDDLSDAAARDPRMMYLASLYAELPSIVEEAGRMCALAGLTDAAAAVRHHINCVNANNLLSDMATAIRLRLDLLGHRQV